MGQTDSLNTVQTSDVPEKVVATADKKETAGAVLFDRVFHDLSQQEKQEARKIVDNYKEEIKANGRYGAMLAVTRKHEEDIRRQCSERGVLPQSGIGIVFIENGGGEDVKNLEGSDARGIGQLMPDTARDYGMRVEYDWKEGGVDERAVPQKSIKVMAMYLRDNKRILADDEGLTIWSYHAGIGNVMWALRVYFMNILGVDIGDLGVAIERNNRPKADQITSKVKELIESKGVSLHLVLQDKAVQNIVLPPLNKKAQTEKTETYPYQAVAAAELFEEEKLSL